MNNELLELIKTRRSCRKYTAEQVSDEQLAAVMEAGTYAPTAHGCQDPVIVAVQRTDIMQRIIKLNAEVRGSAGNPYYDAPTVLLVFASESNANAFQDGSCVLQNMMLAAHAIGLASCWINVSTRCSPPTKAASSCATSVCPKASKASAQSPSATPPPLPPPRNHARRAGHW